MGAIAAGVAVLVWGANRVDPAMSIVIAALVLWSAWGLLRDSAHVLLEGAPAGIEPDEVERAVASEDAVEAVPHLHLWNLASDVPALSAHVLVKGEISLHEAEETGPHQIGARPPLRHRARHPRAGVPRVRNP